MRSKTYLCHPLDKKMLFLNQKQAVFNLKRGSLLIKKRLFLLTKQYLFVRNKAEMPF